MVLEERHIVGGGLDTQHDAVLVIHLDRALAKTVLDASAFDPGGELRADLLRQQRRDLPAEERGDLLGLHVQHRLAHQLLIERSERDAGAERQIGGVFHLRQAPVIGLSEHIGYRAIQLGIPIQRAVQLVRRQRVGHGLGEGPVIDAHERIVGHGVADALRSQLARQPAMAIAVELQAERRPGRHAQIDQPEFGVLEVEIIVQALAAVRPDEGLVCLLVVPGLVGIAGFHGRDDVHQTGAVATLLEHARNNIFLTDMRLGDVLDGNSRFGGQRCRTVAHAVAQRLGKLGVVEDADALGIQIPGHPGSIANPRQRAGDHQSVVARKYPADPVVVAFRQRLAHPPPPATMPQGRLHQTYWFRLRRLREETYAALIEPRPSSSTRSRRVAGSHSARCTIS